MRFCRQGPEGSRCESYVSIYQDGSAVEYPTLTTDLPFLLNLWLNCFSLSAKSVQLESKVSAAFQTVKSIAVEFFPFSCKFLDKLLQFKCKISATVNFLHCTDFALQLHQLKVKSIPWLNHLLYLCASYNHIDNF